MKTTILLVLAAVVLGFSEGKRYRSDYLYHEDVDGWFKLHRVPANWHEARLRCHLEGGTLASPLSDQMDLALKAVTEHHKLHRGIFTGIHATFSRGDYASVEGIPLARIPHRWAEGEPNNKGDDEQCLMRQPSGALADVRCADTFPYVCFRKHTGQLLNACGTFDNEYALDERTGSCYKFHTTPRTWSRAYMACAAEGAHLAIINSDTETVVIQELFARFPPNQVPSRSVAGKDHAYIGLYDWGEHGDWRTIQGQTLEQAGSHWARGQPDNLTIGEASGESCGAVFRSGQVHDLWCGMPYSFICEKAPDSLLYGNEVDEMAKF